ncbi:MAG: GNAT family N-acetyltransferase [Patescibacteria group bacterium]
MKVQEFDKNDKVSTFFIDRWGCDFIVSGEEKLYGKDLPGFAVYGDNKIIGLLTYHLKNNECEIVTLDSIELNSGIGSALLNAMVKKAIDNKYSRLWLMTTNDNIDAMRFYQKRGFVFSGINIDAIQKSRDLGQEIPETGHYNIPIRDEIELEYQL